MDKYLKPPFAKPPFRLSRSSQFPEIRSVTGLQRFQIARFESQSQKPFESLLRLYYFSLLRYVSNRFETSNLKILIGHTPKKSYSLRGRSRHLLVSPFSEPLLKTLLSCQTHSRPPFQNPSENPPPEPFPEPSQNPS